MKYMRMINQFYFMVSVYCGKINLKIQKDTLLKWQSGLSDYLMVWVKKLIIDK